MPSDNTTTHAGPSSTTPTAIVRRPLSCKPCFGSSGNGTGSQHGHGRPMVQRCHRWSINSSTARLYSASVRCLASSPLPWRSKYDGSRVVDDGCFTAKPHRYLGHPSLETQVSKAIMLQPLPELIPPVGCASHHPPHYLRCQASRCRPPFCENCRVLGLAVC